MTKLEAGRRSAPVTIAYGQRAELVRWELTPDGWKARTVAGIYEGRDPKLWHLRCEGKPVTYRRDQWELCTP
jgi:hypothetical protein